MYCGNCGKELDAGSKFCTSCGSALKSQTEDEHGKKLNGVRSTQSSVTRKRSTMDKVLTTAISALALAVLVSGILFYNGAKLRADNNAQDTVLDGADAHESLNSPDESETEILIPYTPPEADNISEAPDIEKSPAAELSVWDGTVADSFAGGNGSQEEPFQIANGEQLALLAQMTNNGDVYHGQYFELVGDIALNTDDNMDEFASGGLPANNWEPIGTKEYPFDANFQGNNHTIYNLAYFAEENVCAGLFGYARNATISDLGVSLALIMGGGNSTLGGIVASVDPVGGNCSITHCSVSGGIALESHSIDETFAYSKVGRLGGIVGTGYAEKGNITVSNCVNKAQICTAYEIGGIVADAYSDDESKGFRFVLSNCLNYGTVGEYREISSKFAGGIAGYADSCVVITNCINSGQVEPGQDKKSVCHWGAIVGYDRTTDGYIENCYFVNGSAKAPYGRTDGESIIQIEVVPFEKIYAPDWLGEFFDLSRDWELIDGELCLKP